MVFCLRLIQSSTMAFLLVFLLFGGNKVHHPFGEVGRASYLGTVFKAGSNSVSMSTLRSFTLIFWKAIGEVPYTFSAVLLLKFLLILLSAPLKLSRSESRHNPITPKGWPMGFQSYTIVRVFWGKKWQLEKEYYISYLLFHLLLYSSIFIFYCSFYRGLFPLWGRNLPCNISNSVHLLALISVVLNFMTYNRWEIFINIFTSEVCYFSFQLIVKC